MNRLLMAAALIVLAACGGVSTQNGNGTDKEGLNGKVHKVQTLIYNAKSQGNETVKDGKPDSYRETDFFPKEDTRIYNAAGQLDSVVVWWTPSNTLRSMPIGTGMSAMRNSFRTVNC